MFRITSALSRTFLTNAFVSGVCLVLVGIIAHAGWSLYKFDAAIGREEVEGLAGSKPFLPLAEGEQRQAAPDMLPDMLPDTLPNAEIVVVPVEQMHAAGRDAEHTPFQNPANVAPVPRGPARSLPGEEHGAGSQGVSVHTSTARTEQKQHFFAINPNEAVPAQAAKFYLLLGSDSRAGHPFAASHGHTGRGRSDIIMVARVQEDRPLSLLSIPRDFYVRLPGYGMDRVNSAYARGGTSLAVKTLWENFGIPIHHTATVNFAEFEGVLQALGGVEICLDRAERDMMSGLFASAGCQRFSSGEALAYARARHAEVLVNGEWRKDGSGDFGRIHRQQAIVLSLLRSLASPGNLARLPSLAETFAGTVVVDDTLDTLQLISLGWDMAGLVEQAESRTLLGKASSVRTARSLSMSVIVATAASQRILDDFKSGF